MLKKNRIYLLGMPIWEAFSLQRNQKPLQKRQWLEWSKSKHLEPQSGEYQIDIKSKAIEVELTVAHIVNSKQIVLVLNDVTEKHLAEERKDKLMQVQAARSAARASQRRFVTQYKVARILENAPNLEIAAPKILEVQCKSLGWRVGGMWVVNESRDKLVSLTMWHPPSVNLREFIKFSHQIQFPRGKGLPGRVWEQNKLSWIADVTKDKNFPRANVAEKYNLRSGLAFPIGDHKEFIGVMEFFSDRIEKPNRQMLTGLATIGIQIAQFAKRKELEKQKDDFIGIASHELKTPLTSVKAYTQVMQRQFIKRNDTTGTESMIKVNAQLDKLTSLVEDLLDVTKIEAGRLRFKPSEFDFNKLAQEVVEEMSLSFETYRIMLKGSASKKIYADRERIKQVLLNLTDNAIKYSPHDSKVVVKLESSAELKVSVQDYGIGIAKHKQSHVFDRFFRISGPQAESFPGLGLGLFISSEIIRRSGGRIWVKSRGGSGSTFGFNLPFSEKLRRKK
jgi:signal transduction histidine kinase